MNSQFLQIIQKVHSLEENQSSFKGKIKSLETQVWDLQQENKKEYHRKPETSLPSGTIILFAGQKVPPGWVLCDGTKGTPDITFPLNTESSENPVYIMKT